ncbi:MAG: SDR family NAD(P)-dependent oxidoreductase [Candidatus Eiseniibacteriota bacterium]
MKDFAGKTAFVTGAASGIGRGIARTFAKAGMNVALADIQADAVEAARAEVAGLGAKAIAVTVDVSERASVERAAKAVINAFGKVHVVCNNAGVSMSGTPVEQVKPEEWDWVIGVNLYGVIHGVQTFLPLIRAHGEGGHIVNTSSIAGFQVRPGFHSGAYAVTKYGVVALSEALLNELEGSGIGVSVLAPAAVDTKIYETAKVRPKRFGGPYARPESDFMRTILEREGLHPDRVGARVLKAIEDEEFFIFTHSAPRAWIEQRYRRIMAAFDRAARFEADSA